MSTLNLEADLVREYLNVCGIDLKLEQCCRLLGDQKLLLCLHFRSVCCFASFAFQICLHKDAQEILIVYMDMSQNEVSVFPLKVAILEPKTDTSF